MSRFACVLPACRLLSPWCARTCTPGESTPTLDVWALPTNRVWCINVLLLCTKVTLWFAACGRGEGRTTAEGEHIPVRVESMDIGYIDGML